MYICGSQPKSPNSSEKMKLHFGGGEQKFIEDFEFMRGRVFTVVVVN